MTLKPTDLKSNGYRLYGVFAYHLFPSILKYHYKRQSVQEKKNKHSKIVGADYKHTNIYRHILNRPYVRPQN